MPLRCCVATSFWDLTGLYGCTEDWSWESSLTRRSDQVSPGLLFHQPNTICQLTTGQYWACVIMHHLAWYHKPGSISLGWTYWRIES